MCQWHCESVQTATCLCSTVNRLHTVIHSQSSAKNQLIDCIRWYVHRVMQRISKSTTYSDTFTEFCKESVNRLHASDTFTDFCKESVNRLHASDTVTEFCKSCLNRRNIYCLVTHLFFLLKFRQEFSIFFCSQTLISWICSAICLASISNSSLDFFVSAVRTRRTKYMRTLHLTRSRDGPYTYRHTYTQKLTQTRARAHTHTHTRACGHARTRAIARTDRYVH